MSKILMTRAELKRLIKEEIPGTSQAKKQDDFYSQSPSERARAALARASNKGPKTHVIPGGVKSGYVGLKGKPDPSAKQPYTKKELSLGADTETSPKSPSFIDRVKGIFKGKENKGGFEDAPSHWSQQDKENYHRNRAINSRDRMKQYAKMFTDAQRQGDSKKKEYARKMHKFYADASSSHEKALKGARV
jgi:hypothetical protein